MCLIVHKGREKLGFNEDDECRVFDESDGTEIDDDDVLLSYNKGSIFVIGKEWKCERSTNVAGHMEVQEDENAAEAMDDYRDEAAGCYGNCASYDDDIGKDLANDEKEISTRELSNEMEKEILDSNSTKNETKDDKTPLKRKMCSGLKETGKC